MGTTVIRQHGAIGLKAIPTTAFAVTIFVSASLVFLVEPMMARLLLPLLGGSAAVWNTSLAFFQIALLAGYLYAHFLQRFRRVGAQVVVHIAVLAMAAALLPLKVSGALGQPSDTEPVLWLMGVLTISLGLPFAALSATAPLVQAWHGRSGADPYPLYAASNLGSLVALLAYPILVERNIGLYIQTILWSAGFVAFAILIGGLGALTWRANGRVAKTIKTEGRSTLRERLIWLALAAIPSSLMLGLTNFITTDLGSAPFLWAVPLALYLGTFIIAFNPSQIIRPKLVLVLQAPIMVACAFSFWMQEFLPELLLHLMCFFLTALVCHQALVAKRPNADWLTDFYIWISLGGVVGGAFNAFLAPVIFTNVIEYPAAFVLACFARPWNQGRAAIFASSILVLLIASNFTFQRIDTLNRWRDFFGVLTISHQNIPGLGDVRFLRHGNTVHGAQSSLPELRCFPLSYYAPTTPIGQVFTSVESRKGEISAAVVGLGTGTIAAYARSGDAFRFFEIDPLDVKVASDPQYFDYTTRCAKGRVTYVVGDARLMLNQEAPENYDLILIDAFSSDSVPSHLLTVEAVKMYLSKLKFDGVLIMHLSNKHLDLMRPAMAAARIAGAKALQQTFKVDHDPAKAIKASGEQVVIMSRSEEAIEPFTGNRRWAKSDPHGVKAWTDDYTDIVGALWRKAVTR